MQKKFYVFIGNYGSGKTELSIQFALDFACSRADGALARREDDSQSDWLERGNSKGFRTALVDLDIVNPYFRSSEKGGLLETAGIKLIEPVFANKTIDSPSLPPEVASVFVDDSERVVFDAGGDPVGATALGRYHGDFASFAGGVEALYVINARRPLSGAADDILEMLDQIQDRARMRITGLVNNTNLSVETTADDLLYGQDIIASVSAQTGISVRYTTGWKRVLDEFAQKTDALGELYPIETRMRPAWLD